MLKMVKKFILVLVLFAAAFVFVGCKKTESRINPSISDSDKVYAEITENSKTYKVTNGKIYAELKASIGVNTLVDLIASDLLSSYIKDVDDADVIKEIDKNVFGEETEEPIGTEERQEMVDEFLDTVFEQYGIDTTDIYHQDIKKVYTLKLAKEAYAAEMLEKEIKKHNDAYNEWVANGKNPDEEDAVKQPYFLDEEYISYYENNNDNKFWAIVIPFASVREFEIALAQKGISINENNKWVKNGKELTAEEITSAYIDLYKDVNNTASDANLDVTKLDETSEFYYTEADLRAINSALFNRVKDYYNEENFYSVEPDVLLKGTLKVLILKLDEKLITPYDKLTAEEKEASKKEAEKSFKEADLTASYVTKKVYELFAEKGIVIYDTVLSNSYATNLSNYSVEYTATEDESTTLVAKVGNIEYTADKLFAEMDKISGATIALSELTYQRFLNNSEINKYYDVEKGEWKNDELKEEIETAIQTEKENFKNGTYVQYGYDPKNMSFETFIDLVYSAKSEKDLLLLFLYSEVVAKYSEGLLDLESTDSKIWEEVIKPKMDEEQAKFFSVKGVHILICAYESQVAFVKGDSILDHEEWTTGEGSQDALAYELAGLIKDYVKAEEGNGTYAERLQKVQKAFDDCPVTSGEASYNDVNVSTTLVSKDGTVTIDVQKYKKAGLYAKFEDLGTFKNGSMVEEFNDAVKVMWDEDFNAGKTDNARVCETIINTEYGYHVYVNLASNKPSAYSEKVDGKDVNYYVPSLEQVREYLEDEDDVDSTVKTLITTYYSPVAKEITGEHLTYVLQYQALKDCLQSLELKTNNYSDAKVKKLIDLNLNNWYENNLKYIDAEDLKYFK